MSVNISRTDGNHGIAGMNGREQIGGRSTGAAVMGDLQQDGLRELLHDAPFRPTFRISLEQRGGRAKGGREHQTIVVRTHGAGDLVASGSKHGEMRSSIVELIAFFFY